MSEPTTPVAEAAKHTLDAGMAKVGTSMTLGGSGTAVVGGFTLNEVAIVFGMLVGGAGLLIQWYYRHKLTMHEIRLREEEAERQRTEHVARLEMMR